ncbi:MAG: hypothetical protein EOO15_05910 [Chitinophagaceae bacterium]|nr:MAG: hypothetical protein EOO15_05910 [Chitinophagaceae bacterium]
MIWKILRRRITHPAGLFNGPFFDVRTLYVLTYDAMPSVTGVGEIDGAKAYAHVRTVLGAEVIKTWQHSYFDRQEDEVRFSTTILQLNGRCMIEIGATYLEVLHNGDFNRARQLVSEVAAFRDRPKEPLIGFARNGSMN